MAAELLTEAPVIRAHDLCFTCASNPRARNSSYCLECWSKYFRTYRKTSKENTQQRLLVRGAELMRQAVLRAFQNIDKLEMNGRTAVEIVRGIQLEL